MKKTVKIWLITAASLVLIGSIAFAGVMTKLEWDFIKLSTIEYETNIHEISEEFSKVKIKTDTADFVFKLSDDGKSKVICEETAVTKHAVTVEDGTLSIEMTDKRTIKDHIGINFGTQKITVYLPKNEYTALIVDESTGDINIPKDFNFISADIKLSTGDVEFYASVLETLKIKTSTGDIHIEDIVASNLELSVSTGKVYLKNIECKNLTSDGDTGDILLKNINAKEKVIIRRSTGNIKFDGYTANEIFAETDTGNVEGL